MFTYDEICELDQLCNENEVFAKYVTRLREENNILLFKVTHEFGNPLTLIDSTAQLIDSRYPEVHNIKYWTQLKNDITSLSELLHNFSNYNYCAKLQIRPINLLELIENTVKSFEVVAMEKEISIKIDQLDNPLDCLLMYACDKVKMRQVLTNIIKNAFEATEEGDYIHVDLPTEIVRLEFDGNKREYIKIEISNNGRPLVETEQEPLFIPFVSNKLSFGGMGLQIAYKIVCAHNGTITMQSTEKETSFSIYLPV